MWLVQIFTVVIKFDPLILESREGLVGEIAKTCVQLVHPPFTPTLQFDFHILVFRIQNWYNAGHQLKWNSVMWTVEDGLLPTREEHAQTTDLMLGFHLFPPARPASQAFIDPKLAYCDLTYYQATFMCKSDKRIAYGSKFDTQNQVSENSWLQDRALLSCSNWALFNHNHFASCPLSREHSSAVNPTPNWKRTTQPWLGKPNADLLEPPGVWH